MQVTLQIVSAPWKTENVMTLVFGWCRVFFVSLLVWFFLRPSKKIQETTRRTIELNLRLETSQDLSYWYKTNVFVGIEREDYSAWKLMLQSVGGKPCKLLNSGVRQILALLRSEESLHLSKICTWTAFSLELYISFVCKMLKKKAFTALLNLRGK